MRRLSSVVHLESVGVCAAVTVAHDKNRGGKSPAAIRTMIYLKGEKNIHKKFKKRVKQEVFVKSLIRPLGAK